MKKQRLQSAGKTVPNRVEPTPHELAALAVAVSQDTTLDNIKYVLSHGGGNVQWAESSDETSVKKALALWLTAREVLEKWRENPASVFPPEPAPTPVPAEPKRYPVTLDAFLKFMLPHLSGRTGEKYGLFREYLKFRLQNPTSPAMIWADAMPGHHIPADRVPFDCCNPRIVPGTDKPYYSVPKEEPEPPEPTKDDVDKYIALWREKGIPDRGSFHYHTCRFREWYQTKHATESSAAKAENAFKAHARKRLQKHLWEKSTDADPKNKIPLKDFPKVTDEQMARLLELNEGKPVKDYRNWSYDIDAAR